jgi:tetratricopeptide (TPR) repeat protein
MPTSFRHATSGLIALLALVVFSIPTLACLWTYGTTIEGKRIEVGEDGSDRLRFLNPNEIKAEWKKKLAELEAQLKPDSDYKLRSDYAAALIHVGENKKAIDVLEEIEKSKPGEYITAANLGTAYELSGENEKALVWIKKGIELNPDSHYGTEWVHVKILEAKLELATDPQWLKTHSVLGLNFGKETRPLMPGLPVPDHTGKEHKVEDAMGAVEYQLHERLAFVSPPDAIVADLLFDLGNMFALKKSVEQAKPMYEMSQKFGPAQADMVMLRLNLVNELIGKYGDASGVNHNTEQRTTMVFVLIGSLIVASAGVIALLLRRAKRA